MKHINKGLLFLMTVILFSACLKDKDVDKGRMGVHPDKNSSIIEIAGPLTGFYNADLIATNSDTTISDFITVRLASNEPANHDIQVTLAVSPTAVSEYNTKNGTHYTVPDAGLYTIPNPTVTIPKGERQAYLKLTTRAANLLGTDYALGIQLTSTSDPGVKLSGNYNKQVVAFAIRNKYDGKYSLSMNLKGWSAYGIADDNVYRNWPRNVDLITAGPNSLTLYDADGNGNLQPGFTAAGGATVFGATTPMYIFDPATDRLTEVRNTTPPDDRRRTLKINSAVTDSHYDPVTKKIYAAYLMTQDGRPDQQIYLTFTYVGPR